MNCDRSLLPQQKLIKVFYNITYLPKLILKYIFKSLSLGTGTYSVQYRCNNEIETIKSSKYYKNRQINNIVINTLLINHPDLIYK